MSRRKFLGGLGLVGAAAVIPGCAVHRLNFHQHLETADETLAATKRAEALFEVLQDTTARDLEETKIRALVAYYPAILALQEARVLKELKEGVPQESRHTTWEEVPNGDLELDLLFENLLKPLVQNYVATYGDAEAMKFGEQAVADYCDATLTTLQTLFRAATEQQRATQADKVGEGKAGGLNQILYSRASELADVTKTRMDQLEKFDPLRVVTVAGKETGQDFTYLTATKKTIAFWETSGFPAAEKLSRLNALDDKLAEKVGDPAIQQQTDRIADVFDAQRVAGQYRAWLEDQVAGNKVSANFFDIEVEDREVDDPSGENVVFRTPLSVEAFIGRNPRPDVDTEDPDYLEWAELAAFYNNTFREAFAAALVQEMDREIEGWVGESNVLGRDKLPFSPAKAWLDALARITENMPGLSDYLLIEGANAGDLEVEDRAGYLEKVVMERGTDRSYRVGPKSKTVLEHLILDQPFVGKSSEALLHGLRGKRAEQLLAQVGDAEPCHGHPRDMAYISTMTAVKETAGPLCAALEETVDFQGAARGTSRLFYPFLITGDETGIADEFRGTMVQSNVVRVRPEDIKNLLRRIAEIQVARELDAKNNGIGRVEPLPKSVEDAITRHTLGEPEEAL